MENFMPQRAWHCEGFFKGLEHCTMGRGVMPRSMMQGFSC